MYLTNPLPLLINSNPFFLLPRQTFRRTSDLINFAAYFTKFALIFKEQIDNQTLKQDTMRGRKLCMKTYQHFFTACRIPGEDKDELYIHKHQPGSCQHFIVAAFNQFTVVYLEQSTTIPSIDELEQCLSNIWNRSKIPLQFQQPNIGILTTENRKIWAKIRTELIEDKTNVESIHLIETSLFILCLDDFILPKTNQRSGYRNSIQIAKMDQSYMSTMLLHGGGSQIHTANRWWDKFLQIIVSKEGICGCIMEHSASEGITMINFLKKFLNFYQQNYHPSSATSTTSSSATIIDANHGQDDLLKQSTTTTTTILKSLPLRWNITLDLDKHIKQAEKHADKSINDLDFYVLKFNEYGSDFIKQQKISPDAYIQLSLQLTFFKLHRYIVSSYESCSIRHFQNGRVDTIRSSTKEARDWAKSMCPQPTSTLTTTTTTTSNNLIVEDVEEDQKIKLFKRAIQKQVEIMHYTMNGHGPENHLRALRELSKKNFNTIPAIFREKSFGEYGNYRLSTSQLPTDIDIIIGYGPVVPDGYGCAYTPKKDHIIFCVSSFYSSDETSSDFFALSLEGSLLQMRELCLRMNANGSSATFSARTPDI
ncbi:choline O-acetyltransferase-like [Dermatophagoides pteronyssinus]|uniref:choline O-acetyltransferase-like n=1 Tax=Dermatophagoides pteronyssinus TaxID=6956 RepID=UPI003F67F78F